jgi:hypothetical protein
MKGMTKVRMLLSRMMGAFAISDRMLPRELQEVYAGVFEGERLAMARDDMRSLGGDLRAFRRDFNRVVQSITEETKIIGKAQ